MLTTKLIGNLGNKLFEIWSLIGMANDYGHDYVLPHDDLYNYFKGPFKPGYVVKYDQIPEYALTDKIEVVKEYKYPYHMWPILKPGNYELHGYRQSEKYWKNNKQELEDRFTFTSHFITNTIDKLPGLFDKPVICISIRRGDFVGNPVYYQLPITYYIGALLTHFPDYENYNLLFLSDDMAYCRTHFECLPNAFFAEGLTAMEQLCLGAWSQHHIISNSTFSWWCAYLAEKYGDHGKVIRPKYNFGEAYRQANPETDYWPDRNNWIVFDHEGYKIDLKDTTFMIPVFHDHIDRKQNLDLTVCMLQRDFHIGRIMVSEQGGNKFSYMSQWCEYIQFNSRHFHRTKMLNDMALMADTPILANWDADVFIPPMQIHETVKRIRAGVPFVYPYDGRFARVVRKLWFKPLAQALDVGIFGDRETFGPDGRIMAHSSVGGAVFMDKQVFIGAGMENEYMISYAPEDCERWDRWHKLGARVERIKGKLFHMDHWIGKNSSTWNPYFKANHAELDKIRAMTKEALIHYIAHWAWHPAWQEHYQKYM